MLKTPIAEGTLSAVGTGATADTLACRGIILYCPLCALATAGTPGTSTAERASATAGSTAAHTRQLDQGMPTTEGTQELLN